MVAYEGHVGGRLEGRVIQPISRAPSCKMLFLYILTGFAEYDRTFERLSCITPYICISTLYALSALYSFSMKLSITESAVQIGGVEIDKTVEVLALEGQCSPDTTKSRSLSPSSLGKIESQLAIVVPCKNEDQESLTGVLRGIPCACLIVLVSNSDVTKFELEQKLFERLCRDEGRQGILVHQKDTQIAVAFQAAGMCDILEGKISDRRAHVQWKEGVPCVRDGKGEAMIIGVVLAKLVGKRYVGFVDADNCVPGSVLEYCKIYAAGLHSAINDKEQMHAMVRIVWNSKPNVQEGKIVFRPSGRCSLVVNEWMNRLVRVVLGGSQPWDIIQTANAGEHAMDLDLAFRLQLASGYANEPYQLINAFEGFEIVPNCTNDQICAKIDSGPTAADKRQDSTRSQPPKVRVVQVKSLNPHFHNTNKGDQHILDMICQGLGAIYWSPLAGKEFKEEIQTYCVQKLAGFAGPDKLLPRSRVYQPLKALDLVAFKKTLEEGSNGQCFVVHGLVW
jgi:mannosyl-3-phosphoglycerate synthase